jgi:hypothetical protein
MNNIDLSMTYFKLLQRMKMIWHPVASPLFIGLGLPQLYYEKRYTEIPVLIVMPVFYTALLTGIEIWNINEYGFDNVMQRRAGGRR